MLRHNGDVMATGGSKGQGRRDKGEKGKRERSKRWMGVGGERE